MASEEEHVEKKAEAVEPASGAAVPLEDRCVFKKVNLIALWSWGE